MFVDGTATESFGCLRDDDFSIAEAWGLKSSDYHSNQIA